MRHARIVILSTMLFSSIWLGLASEIPSTKATDHPPSISELEQLSYTPTDPSSASNCGAPGCTATNYSRFGKKSLTSCQGGHTMQSPQPINFGPSALLSEAASSPLSETWYTLEILVVEGLGRDLPHFVRRPFANERSNEAFPRPILNSVSRARRLLFRGAAVAVLS